MRRDAAVAGQPLAKDHLVLERARSAAAAEGVGGLLGGDGPVAVTPTEPMRGAVLPGYADLHCVAWKVRHRFDLDAVSDGVTLESNDNIVFDIEEDRIAGRPASPSGFGHPACGAAARPIAEELETTIPTGPG